MITFMGKKEKDEELVVHIEINFSPSNKDTTLATINVPCIRQRKELILHQ